MRQAEEQGVIFETLHLRKDGGAFPVEVSSRVIVIGERKFFFSIIRDISERKKSEQRISHLNRLYAFLSQINQAVVYTRDHDHLLKEACRIAIEHGRFAKAWIAMVNRETNVITMAAHSGCDETAFRDIHLIMDEHAVGDPVEHALFRDGKRLIICNDVENDSEVNVLRKDTIGLGCRAFASVPLRLGGTMIGLFNVCTNEVNLFNAEIIRLLEEIAGDISFALDLMEQETRRHEAEQKLRESEKVYRTIFETTGTATIIVEEDASIVLANKECEILSGFTREELEGGMRWTSFVTEDDLERMMNFHVARRQDPASAPSTYSFKFLNRFGIVKHIYLKVALIPGTRRSVVSLLDVTPVMLMESALRESEDLFTKVFQSSPTIMAINTLSDGQFYEVNESFSRILGYAHDEVVGGSVLELSIWDNPDQWAGLLETLKSCGAVHNLEIMFRKKSGESFIGLTSLEMVTLRGEPYILSVASDITEMKRVENALRESEASYRALAENLPGIVYRIFIQQNYRMLFFNDMLEKMTGYDPSEMTRGDICSIDPLILPEDRGHVVEMVKSAIEKDQPFEVEYRLKHKDGAIRHFLERGRPRVGDNGEPLYIDGVILDITERKLLENSLRQTHRLEAIGTMAGGIAHDFNNILGVIIGYTEMALYDIPESSPFHLNFKQILRAGLRAKGIVQQILTFSRQQQKELERRPVDLGSVIEEALTLLRASLPSTIEICRNIDNVSDMALADPGQMHQVLINLCNNAAHAMREKGGLIEVSLTEMQSDSSNAALYPELKPGAYLRLGVSDTGNGMDPATLERIFDPYFTTKAVGEGSGLGLAVVQGIVKQHAGAIRVYSESGKGAVFHIFIPKAESPQKVVVNTRDHLQEGNERILIVDDEESLVGMASKMLKRLGYRVTSKTSSVEALEVFRENPQEFDLVLTDYTMPHMTGIDLIRQLISIRSDIPVILCTGLDDIILNEEEMKESGIGEFLRKPYTMQHIAEAIRRVLKGRS
jgi:PAS domain S-box-containing protein